MLDRNTVRGPSSLRSCCISASQGLTGFGRCFDQDGRESLNVDVAEDHGAVIRGLRGLSRQDPLSWNHHIVFTDPFTPSIKKSIRMAVSTLPLTLKLKAAHIFPSNETCLGHPLLVVCVEGGTVRSDLGLGTGLHTCRYMKCDRRYLYI